MAKILDWLEIGWVVVSFAVAPLHVFPSGMPQPGDLLLFGWALLSIFRGLPRLRLPRESLRAIGPLVMLLAYMALWNGVWFAIRADVSTGLHVLYYLFNLMVVLGVVSAWARGIGQRSLVAGVVAGLIGCLASIPFYYDSGSARNALGFNNPNQLGYFSLLLCVGFVMLAERREGAWRWLEVGCLAGGLALVAISNSKAAVVALVWLILFRSLRSARLALGLTLVVGAMVLLWGAGEGSQLQRSRDRVASLGSDHDDSIEGRGYDRIFRHPEYLLIGAGEGGADRFAVLPGREFELHSSWGTLAFSYGVAGMVLFVLFVSRIARRGWRVLGYLLPLGLYGVAHQGLRESLLWIVLCIAALKIEERVPDGSRARVERGPRIGTEAATSA